ncbi:MAG: NACHT domain-containing protein [bacterium]
MDKLRRQLKARPARARVLVLDVPAEHVATLADLDFGRCAVRAFGPGVASKLVDALLPDHAGDVTAAAVADALGGVSDEGDYVLNRRVAGDRPASHHDEAFVAYLLGLKEESDRLVFDRATRSEGRARTLADVYEPLHTRGGDDAGPERHGPGEDAPPPQTAHGRVAAHRCVFLVGDPGAGKTSFLLRLAAELCEVALGERAPLPGLPADPLPVFFRLADFKGAPDARSLLDLATARLCCAGGRDELPGDAVDDALRAGRLVLLLDGLDEVQAADGDARQRRRQLAAAIATLAGREASRAHVVATCRPAAAQDGAVPPAPFVRVDLLPLDAAQITRVATHWLAGRDATEDAAAQARQLTADLGQHAAVRVLAGNPLTLAMICVLAYRQKRLPRDRNELYDELLTLLLEDRDRASPDQARKRRAWLTAIAWRWWQAGGTRDPESIIREDRAARMLQDAGLSEDAAYAEVRFLDERAGLLIWRDTERGYRRLRFAHRSFAEFLVACHLSEKAPAQALIDADLDPGWEGWRACTSPSTPARTRSPATPPGTTCAACWPGPRATARPGPCAPTPPG